MPKRKEAVTIVCFNRMNGLMLATHRKHSVAEWGLPGGKIDEGESPLEAVIRELGEETPYTVIIDNLEYLGVFPCYGPTNYNVHTYFVKDTSLMKLNLSLVGVEQNYAWIHPRLLTFGPFFDFNRKLFYQFKDKIFSKLYNHMDWKTGLPCDKKAELPEDYEV